MKNVLLIIVLCFIFLGCGERKDAQGNPPLNPGDYAVIREGNISVQIKRSERYSKNNGPDGYKYDVRLAGTNYEVSNWVMDYDLINPKVSNVPNLQDLK
jgi:hypothetical protein